jgi:hypothetical protein
MSTTLGREAAHAASATRTKANVATATGFIATILASAAGIVVGLLWDISWHMSVGRDTFWSPPHMLEYVSGVVAGLSCGFVVLRTTFAGTAEDRAASVKFWGFLGPLGAWITIWGTFAMLLSAPFDDWWHNAYGLDVKIVSPPHMVLLSGMLGIMLGALTLTVSAQNRSAGKPDQARDAWMYAAAGGVLCFILACATLEYSWPNEQHRALYYQVWGAVFPLLLVGYASAGRLRWPATGAALVFMGLWLAMGLGLRMVDAQPMLAPIYNPRTYMWPPYFPAWLIVPAFGIDLVLQRLRGRNPWLVALALGAAFVALHAAVQYPWSMFMLSPYARNGFFNGGEFPYTARIGTWTYNFWIDGRGNRLSGSEFSATVFAQGLLIAALLATLSSRLGLAWGGWMARVKR